jgi:predicted chitinase
MNSVLVELKRFGFDLGMIKPHILAQFFPQIMHESGDFRSAVEEKPVVPVAVDKSR